MKTFLVFITGLIIGAIGGPIGVTFLIGTLFMFNKNFRKKLNDLAEKIDNL